MKVVMVLGQFKKIKKRKKLQASSRKLQASARAARFLAKRQAPHCFFYLFIAKHQASPPGWARPVSSPP